MVAARKLVAAEREAKLREAVAKKHQAYNEAKKLKEHKPTDASVKASLEAPKAKDITAPQEPTSGPAAAQGVEAKVVAPPQVADAEHENDSQAPRKQVSPGSADKQNSAPQPVQLNQQQESAIKVAIAAKVKKLKAAKAAKLLVTARHYVPVEQDVEPPQAERQAEAQALEERTKQAVRARVKWLKERKAAKAAKLAAWFDAASDAIAEQDSQQSTDLPEVDALAVAQEHEDAIAAAVRLKVQRWKEAKAAKIAESASKYAAAQEKVRQEVERQESQVRADTKVAEAARMASVRSEVQRWKDAKAEKIAKAAAWKAAVLQESRQQSEVQQAKERSEAQKLEAATMAAVRVKVRALKEAKRAKQAQQAAWLAAILKEIEEREAEANAEAAKIEEETEVEVEPSR